MGTLESPAPLRMVQFSDTHLMGDPAARLRGVATLHSFQACVTHARTHYFPVDALLVTGDVVHDEPAGYRALERLLSPLAVPALVIAGNHDLPDAMRRQLGRLPFQTDGAFDAGAWRVLLLESWFAASARGEGRLGPAQLARLDAELVAHADRHTLLALHHPPMKMDAPGLDDLRLEDESAFMAVVAAHPQVKAVVWGHAHQALDVLHGGARYLGTPSTCFQFGTRASGFAIDKRPPGYRVLDLGADGSVATEVVWLDGYRA